MNAGPATATLFFPLRPRHPSPCAARSSLFPFGPAVSLSRFASFTAGSSAILLFPLPRLCVLSCYLILYSTSGCTCFPRSWFHFFPPPSYSLFVARRFFFFFCFFLVLAYLLPLFLSAVRSRSLRCFYFFVVIDYISLRVPLGSSFFLGFSFSFYFSVPLLLLLF